MQSDPGVGTRGTISQVTVSHEGGMKGHPVIKYTLLPPACQVGGLQPLKINIAA